ncbi:trimeric intracellular cation channel family protein [Sporomusa sp.]|uniref:trimeric intracellular cation channel family protein n=1 Tax=Sporomusa sp. TaxID=2078658 RepID=UPI002CD2D9D0|nr:trimeric intracellular cation channel family protein [Sporomusa sp.]HWR44599.1 trimeric intracellular cation channel family protein [Sporomusa sp.]
MTAWNVFEITGIIAFAISGALTGIQKRLDVFGVLVLAITTAIGGGILRDVIIGNTPPLTFRDPTFFIISSIATVGVCFTYRWLDKFKHTIQIFDAIGLGAFTATSANLALQHNLDSLFIVTTVAVITGIGGSIMRDVFVKEIPYVFRQEVYAITTIAGAISFYYSQFYFTGNIPLYLCFAITTGLRICCIKYGWNFPVIGIKSGGIASDSHNSGN